MIGNCDCLSSFCCCLFQHEVRRLRVCIQAELETGLSVGGQIGSPSELAGFGLTGPSGRRRRVVLACPSAEQPTLIKVTFLFRT